MLAYFHHKFPKLCGKIPLARYLCRTSLRLWHTWMDNLFHLASSSYLEKNESGFALKTQILSSLGMLETWLWKWNLQQEFFFFKFDFRDPSGTMMNLRYLIFEHLNLEECWEYNSGVKHFSIANPRVNISLCKTNQK